MPSDFESDDEAQEPAPKRDPNFGERMREYSKHRRVRRCGLCGSKKRPVYSVRMRDYRGRSRGYKYDYMCELCRQRAAAIGMRVWPSRNSRGPEIWQVQDGKFMEYLKRILGK